MVTESAPPAPSTPVGSDGAARRFLLVLLAIAAIALVGRVTYIVTVAQHDERFYDAYIYLSLSEAVVDGRGFETPFFGGPDASHPPLTAISLLPASALTDLTRGYLPQRITMAVLGAISVVVIGLLGRAVAGPRVGLIAAGLAAIYPHIWLANSVVMAETLAILITALALLVTYRFLRKPTRWGAAGIGALCGLAALTRAELLLLVPMLALPAVLVVKDVPRRAKVGLLAVAVVACGATIAPWVVRNLVTYREPTFLSTGDGTALLSTNCDETYHGPNIGLSELECAYVVKATRDQSVSSARQRSIALEYMGDHFDRLPVVVAVRVLRMWDLYRPFQSVDLGSVEGRSKKGGFLALGMYYALVPLTVGGVLVLRRRGITTWPLIVPLALATVIAVIAQGALRYRAPAEVSLVVLGAVGVEALWIRCSNRRAPLSA